MKKILGLDLGTNSIGWALVNEAENTAERSSIIKIGVRVNPLTVDELQNFKKGKSITTNAVRAQKRSMRRNLQRYKLRRQEPINVLTEAGFISNESILSEHGNKTTFETYRLRAKAATEQISLEEFARVLLMINKKRGYKSSRKAKSDEEGTLIDGMEIAKKLYGENITPGELCLQLIKEGKKTLPNFYRSDLQDELNRIWNFQKRFHPLALTDEAKEEIKGKNKPQTWAILAKYFEWKDMHTDYVTTESATKNKKIVGIKRDTKGKDQKRENYEWRMEALSQKMDLERLAIVFQEINGDIHSSSGYLGAIGDRSKLLYFNNQTVGQYLMDLLDKDPNVSLKNTVFYRQDYLDEFERIWKVQAKYHKELTDNLKHTICDIIIFYQRRLKSQKSLISICEFEQTEKEIIVDGKSRKITIGSRVIPRSSPLFQEFKIWQILNNIEVTKKADNSKFYLTQEEKELLAEELSVNDKLEKSRILKLLFKSPNKFDLNYKSIEGDKTSAALYQAFNQILEMSGHKPLDFNQTAKDIKSTVKEIFTSLSWNTDILSFDSAAPLDEQPYYKLWHLLYSFEGDNTRTGDGNLKEKIAQLCGFDKKYAQYLVNVSLLTDYGSLSAKAVRKILPYLKEGNKYDVSCVYAGYRHSASSLTKDEIESKTLKDKLELLPKNSLHNPVVEKILNQMVNYRYFWSPR